MPTGDFVPRGRRRSGFAYMGLLMLLALLGAALGEAGQVWRTQAQREREAELRFRGEQIRLAIVRYRAATRPAAWPPSLEALLEDRRGGRVRHHLRRLWTDPFTGAADWVLLPPPAAAAQAAAGAPAAVFVAGAAGQAGVAGVRSRSDVLRLGDPATPAAGPNPRVSDWRFEVAAGPSPSQAQPPAREPGGRSPS
jgi:type II secretory pathway pseudopilin PulG